MGFDATRDSATARQFIGYMPEHDCLPTDMVATEFVAHMARMSGLPRTAARERTADSLRHVGLYEERYRQIRGFSTGMKQRVKLAQAIVHDPRLLLLDEPTNGLDPTGREEMLDLIERTGRVFGIAILMASHLLSEIERICDHVVVLDGGHLLRSAAIGEYTARNQVLAVEVESGAEALAGALASRGLRVTHVGRLVLVETDGDRPHDAVRDAVVELDLSLLRVEQQRRSLEDVFRTPQEAGAGHAGQ